MHFLPSLSLSSLSPLLLSSAFPQLPLLSFSAGPAGRRWGGDGLGPLVSSVYYLSFASFLVVEFLPSGNKPDLSPLLFFLAFLIFTMEVKIEATGAPHRGGSEARR